MPVHWPSRLQEHRAGRTHAVMDVGILLAAPRGPSRRQLVLSVLDLGF
jgi:hypothetical protein